jgi:pyruvate formate lyase activating enzyme
MKGLLFDIKRFAVNDGPGIRVTYFLKGCPLSCAWCHNPESIVPGKSEMRRIRRVGEKEFVSNEIVGREYSSEELLEVAVRERPFIEESGGGVTFSGGEPLLQADFLLGSLMLFRQAGYHTVVDTSGYAPPDILKQIVPYTSLFLYDIKHIDSGRHREATGVTNTLILDNLNLLLDAGSDITVRIPVLPSFNSDSESMNAIRNYLMPLRGNGLRDISLIPYHASGRGKYEKLGREYGYGNFGSPEPQYMEKLKQQFRDSGFRVVDY